jgi:hypothetical protein
MLNKVHLDPTTIHNIAVVLKNFIEDDSVIERYIKSKDRKSLVQLIFIKDAQKDSFRAVLNMDPCDEIYFLLMKLVFVTLYDMSEGQDRNKCIYLTCAIINSFTQADYNRILDSLEKQCIQLPQQTYYPQAA